MEILVEKESVIVQGIRPEEQLWGAYQFPTPYRLKDGIACSVHITEDNINTFRQDTKRWFKSVDGGESWGEMDGSAASECGLLLPNGERLFFPQVGSVDVSDYTFTHMSYMTPATDMKEKAPAGVFPIQDGLTFDMGGNLIYAYDADRLPAPLDKKEWLSLRLSPGESQPTEEYVPLKWDRLTRVVYVNKSGKKTMRSIFPHGRGRIGPDGAIWISTYSGDGHIDPKTGLYNQYYSAEILRSEDNGHSFAQVAHMEYPADGTEEYPYLSGGFSDNDFEFMPDGSMVWIFRSAWFARTGYEWSPMYIAYSENMGKSWTKPVPFTPTGVYPSICRLDCGGLPLDERSGARISYERYGKDQYRQGNGRGS